MRNKFFFIFLLVVFSCKEKSEELITNNLMVSELKPYVHDVHFEDSALLIWRIGSIEWSEYGSLIVLNPITETNSTIDVSYYEFYDNINDNGLSYARYKFSLRVANNAYRTILKGYNEKNEKRKNSNRGEGACSNDYYIEKAGGNSAVKLVNSSSNRDIIDCVSNLFKQISPKEYYQSLALDKKCYELVDLKNQLYFGKFPDSMFQIPYEKCVPYWNGKPLEKKQLPTGEIIYVKPK